MRISDWSSDVCSSDLRIPEERWPIGRTKRIAHELVACPLADMRPCNVANVIKVEAQNRSKPGKTDGVLRSLQTCLEQPVIIDAAFPVLGLRDRTSKRLNSSHYCASRMPSSA